MNTDSPSPIHILEGIVCKMPDGSAEVVALRRAIEALEILDLQDRAYEAALEHMERIEANYEDERHCYERLVDVMLGGKAVLLKYLGD